MCEYPRVFALYTGETVEKVERKGEREFALCPFQPSVFLCVSAPLFLFLIPPFSCCQSSLSFCQFVFRLRIISSCFFLTLISLFTISSVCRVLFPFFVICSVFNFLSYFYCLTIIQPSVWFYFVVTGKTGNYSHSAHDQFPNAHSSHVA